MLKALSARDMAMEQCKIPPDVQRQVTGLIPAEDIPATAVLPTIKTVIGSRKRTDVHNYALVQCIVHLHLLTLARQAGLSKLAQRKDLSTRVLCAALYNTIKQGGGALKEVESAEKLLNHHHVQKIIDGLFAVNNGSGRSGSPTTHRRGSPNHWKQLPKSA